MTESTSSGEPPKHPADQLAVSAQVGHLVSVVTQPAFRRLIKEVEGTPSEQRLEAATRLATVDNLRARGVSIPQGLRLSMRWFENDPGITHGSLTGTPEAPAVTKEAAAPEAAAAEAAMIPAGLTICLSLGFFICASVGWSPSPSPSP